MLLTDEKARQEVIKKINALDLSFKKYVVDITVHREKRSLPQNGLYWMWLRCISDETGNSEYVLHEYFKKKYIGYKNEEIFGYNIQMVSSTRILNTKQFSEYMDKIKDEMNNLEIYLPEPGDYGWTDFELRYGKEYGQIKY